MRNWRLKRSTEFRDGEIREYYWIGTGPIGDETPVACRILSESDARIMVNAQDAVAVMEHAVSELMRAYKMTAKLETQDHEFGARLNELVMRLNEDIKLVISKSRGES